MIIYFSYDYLKFYFVWLQQLIQKVHELLRVTTYFGGQICKKYKKYILIIANI